MHHNVHVKKAARILVGLECGYSCSYCCNKLPEVKARFKKLKWKDIPATIAQYDIINISGGEPLHPRNYLTTLPLIHAVKSQHKKLFVYTNLSHPDVEYLCPFVDGWNIGYHPSQTTWLDFCKRVNYFLQQDPKGVRVQVEFGQEWQIEKMLLPNTVTIKTWIRNQCFVPNETIYLLEEEE